MKSSSSHAGCRRNMARRGLRRLAVGPWLATRESIPIQHPPGPAARARFAAWLGCLLALFAGGRAAAESVTLRPVADTSILQAFPFNNLGGNEYFTAGTTQNYTTNRGLLRFDPAAVIPVGARIRSASLMLEVVGDPSDGITPSTFGVFRMRVPWGEGVKAGHPPQQPGLGRRADAGEATWRESLTGTAAWSAPGAVPGVDFSAAASAETFVYGSGLSPYYFDPTPALVADVQGWLDAPASNFGWLVDTVDGGFNFTARRFASREDPRAPQLTIDYDWPALFLVSAGPAGATLRVAIAPGRNYRIEVSDDLVAWEELAVREGVTEGSVWTVNDAVARPRAYYRLVVTPAV